jgi:hypothetical protein
MKKYFMISAVALSLVSAGAQNESSFGFDNGLYSSDLSSRSLTIGSYSSGFVGNESVSEALGRTLTLDYADCRNTAELAASVKMLALSAAYRNDLSQMSVNAPELYRKYRSGAALKGVGMGLTLAGIFAMVVGIATADKETVTSGTQTTVNLSGSGAYLFAAGLISVVPGIPLWVVGSSKKRRAANAYLREYGGS